MITQHSKDPGIRSHAWWAALCLVAATGMGGAVEFRPPAVPLVASDPYLSIWSEADQLTGDTPRHWTKAEHSLASLIRVDGEAYRLMGKEPGSAPTMPQVSVKVTPTRSIYEFKNAKVQLTLTFMTPMLPGDLEVLSRPVTYLTWDVRSVDGSGHAVSLYESASSQLAVSTQNEEVQWARETMGPLTALRAGTHDQHYLSNPGDATRINWGYAYLAAPAAQAQAVIGAKETLFKSFVERGNLPAQDDPRMPRAVSDEQPVMAFAFDLGKVGAKLVSRHLMVAYDEVHAIKYFGRKLRPYWRRHDATPSTLLQQAEQDYPKLIDRCIAFDKELTEDLVKAGGEKYAVIAALAYRQAIAATGIAADDKEQPLVFTKENSSNGDIATVDVLFPMSPIFLLTNPTLAKAMVVPIMDYSASSHWKFPNAPHDLGLYPIVSGRDDGGEAMPVEESGNMLILCDAIAQIDGNTKFLDRWWAQLTQWAQFLEQYGLDPENQLCTDDFMGHLAHNTNLSVKAILALAAYGDMARMRGDMEAAKKYLALAEADAKHWMEVADAGDYSLLAFDKPGTWSQKYNMVWDKVLGLNVFPAAVAQKEIAHYLKMIQPYGLPLDSRTKYGDLDHSFFSATLAEKDADFQAIIASYYAYLEATTARLPLADLYRVDDINSGILYARPVVGGAFIKMIADRAMWKKWASRDQQKFGPWAALPQPPMVTPVVPTGQHETVTWRYITEQPGADWMKPGFDDSGWKQGAAGFGGAPGLAAHTPWAAPDIWIRREFTMPAGDYPNLQFLVFHDEDVEIYLNGLPAAKEGGYNAAYEPMEMTASARALLKPGAQITLTAHVHQTGGGQGVDIGIANVTEAKP